MKRKIKICYIDDRLDSMISRYLYNYCVEKNQIDGSSYDLESIEYEFQQDDDYKTLLSNDLVNQSNIIIIDSWLFENQSSHLSKFTGEQFKIILRQVLPFIKTIVISQNTSKPNSLTIPKYQASGLENETIVSQKFYADKLAPVLDMNVLAVIEEFYVLSQIENEEEIDPVLIGTIQSTINGIHDTALFEKEDLDELIRVFSEVKNNYEN